MKKLTLLFAAFLCATVLMAQKKSLDPSVYDSWKSIGATMISDNGDWSIYSVNPQEGDNVLYLRNNLTGKQTGYERGTSPVFFDNTQWVYFNVISPLAQRQKYEVDKVAKDKQAKDTTVIVRLSDMKTKRLTGISNLSASRKGGLIAWLEEYEKPKAPAKKEEPKEAADGEKKETTKKHDFGKLYKLVVWNTTNEQEPAFTMDSVSSFSLAENGKSLLFDKVADGARNVYSGVVTAKGITTTKLADLKLGKVRNLSLYKDGNILAFGATQDTAKTAVYDIYYGDVKGVTVAVSSKDKKMPAGFSIAPGIGFTKDGALTFGIRPIEKVYEEVKKPKAQQFSFDLWSWHDTLLQTQQIGSSRNQIRNFSYSCIYHPKTKSWLRLTDLYFSRVSMPRIAGQKLALLTDSYPYTWWSTIDSPTGNDIYLVDVTTGARELIFKKALGRVMMSASGKYILNYNVEDQHWYAYNIATKKNVQIGKDIAYPIWNELSDTPTYPSPYGVEGWTKDDARVLINDKYDIWSVDPTGVAPSENITKIGRQTNRTFSRLALPVEDEEEDLFIDLKKPILLSSFDNVTRDAGYFTLTVGKEPQKLVETPHRYTPRAIAKNGKDVLFLRESYTEVPNLWKGTIAFNDAKQITDINPQSKEYKWGSVQLTSWTDFNGDTVEGLLYLPENYSKDKTYPTIVYFYERNTENLHKFHMPQPSWSVIIPSYCVSNDYVVLIPDIKYTTGYPGKSSYDAIVSGTMALIERGIAKKEKIALQGQSWGGYATAYLITQTNLYACAAPGAPVSNMTSAYGGIRWTTGMARSFQYEHGQSRIGATPWERRDLYIDNSPLFFADRVTTPVFIRHDDADEAVPWYQGIEFYIALRRLGKPVWMINYNNEPHNLANRYARKDFSQRLYQFLDYYLKDTDMPRWMKEGIPHELKGKEFKLDLVPQQK